MSEPQGQPTPLAHEPVPGPRPAPGPGDLAAAAASTAQLAERVARELEALAQLPLDERHDALEQVHSMLEQALRSARQ